MKEVSTEKRTKYMQMLICDVDAKLNVDFDKLEKFVEWSLFSNI